MISKHRVGLLAERYHFNMGLLMGECGARQQPLPGALPRHPPSWPPAMGCVGCPGSSCCVAVLQTTRCEGDVLCFVMSEPRAGLWVTATCGALCQRQLWG